MKCEEVQAKLTAYLDDEVSGADRDLMREHLAACRVCSRELGEMSALNVVLDEVRVPAVPAGFAEKVLAAAAGRMQRRKVTLLTVLMSRRFVRRAAAVAALAAGLLLGGFMGSDLSPNGDGTAVSGAQESELRLVLDSFSAVPAHSFVAEYFKVRDQAN